MKIIYLNETITQAIPIKRGVPKVVQAFIKNHRVFESELGVTLVPVSFNPLENKWNEAPYQESRYWTPKSGDLLINLDSWWAGDHSNQIVGLSKKGVRILSVVYDLIPIRHPTWFQSSIPPDFKMRLHEIIQSSGKVFCISNYVKKDLEKFLIEAGQRENLDRLEVDYFHLGFDGIQAKYKEYSSALPKTALTIGAIEPRKGISEMIDTFTHFLDKVRTNLTWHLVGGHGDGALAIIQKIQSNPYFGKNIFYHGEVSDDALAKLFNKADLVICPSMAEGFGLPLIEAISKGKPVLANDIEVFREVAGDSCLFFDVKSPGSFSEALEKLNEFRPGPNQPPPLTWEQSIQSFCKKSKAFFETTP